MKTVITARNFPAGDPTCLQILKDAGLDIELVTGREFGFGASDEDVYEAIHEADFVISGLEPFHESTLIRCPNLKLISRRGIGYDSVDVDACERLGIAVSRTTGTVEGAVSEQVMAYILYFSRRLDLQNSFMQKREWNRIQVPGAKTRVLGLIGFGGIGKEIARRAVPFGMDVVYNCRHPKEEWNDEYGVRYLPMNELLEISDYVSVNVPLTAASERMIGKEQFRLMKPSAIFINISRSPVMDVDALVNALQSGQIGGAAIDVYPTEPCTDSSLVGCPNTILTPHTASFTLENHALMNQIAAQNVVDFIHGSLDAKYRLV